MHAPQIKENLLSVQDLTKHGQISFSQITATLHKPKRLPRSKLSAHYHEQCRLTPKATAKGSRTYRRKTSTQKPPAKPNTSSLHQHHTSTPQRRSDQMPINTTRQRKPTLCTTPVTPLPAKTAAERQMGEWHIRLNHANSKTIAYMSRHRLLPGLPKGLPDTSVTMTWTGGIHGKTATRPHKRTAHTAHKGESLSSDVCGPIQPTSNHNCDYLITLIDTAHAT